MFLELILNLDLSGFVFDLTPVKAAIPQFYSVLRYSVFVFNII